MGYSKQIAKQVKKTEILRELVLKHDYEGALRALNPAGSSATGTYGRYLMAFSLFKMGRFVEALVHWWPLVNERRSLLEQDGEVLARQAFSEKSWVAYPWRELTLETLETLLAAALHFSINNSATQELEGEVRERIWTDQAGHEEEVWRLLRAAPRLSYAKLIWEAKAAFQRPRKAPLKPFEFASVIISAGASSLALMSHSSGDLYASDSQAEVHLRSLEALQALSREISVASNVIQPGEAEHSRMQVFLMVECFVLDEILKKCTIPPPSGALLSPGYVHFRNLSDESARNFREWLTRTCPRNGALASLYERSVYNALLALIRGQSLPEIEKRPVGWECIEIAAAFQPNHKGELNRSRIDRVRPWQDSSTSFFAHLATRLVLMFVCQVKADDSYFPEVAIGQIAEIARATADPDLGQVAEDWAFHNAGLALKRNQPWLDELVRLESQLASSDFSQKLAQLTTRFQQCSAFLKTLSKKTSSSRKSVAALVQSKEAFLQHLQLVVDTFVLAPPHLTPRSGQGLGEGKANLNISNSFFVPFMSHWAAFLLAAQSLPLPVEEEIAALKDCRCDSCEQLRYTNLLQFAASLGVQPTILSENFEIERRKRAQGLKGRLYSESTSQDSVFTREDPFSALEIAPTYSKQAILTQVMKKMAANPRELARLRQLQNRAFDPHLRFLYALLKGSTMPSLLENMSQETRFEVSAQDLSRIELRPREQVQ